MLVIIPGWMHAAKEWAVVSDILTRSNIEHTVLDIPGFGANPPDPDLSTMKDLVTWCESKVMTIQSQSQSPLILVGHSCGGRVGLQLAANELHMHKLVLIGSPNLYRPSTRVQLTRLLVAILRPFQSLIPASIRLKLRSDDYTAAKGTPMHNLYLSVVTEDQTELLHTISTHVQLLWGEHDTAAPVRIAREMHEKLSSSRLTIIPKLGHNLHHENPQLLAGKLKEYVEVS